MVEKFKHPKFLSQRIRERVFKHLGTILNLQSNVPSLLCISNLKNMFLFEIQRKKIPLKNLIMKEKLIQGERIGG